MNTLMKTAFTLLGLGIIVLMICSRALATTLGMTFEEFFPIANSIIGGSLVGFLLIALVTKVIYR